MTFNLKLIDLQYSEGRESISPQYLGLSFNDAFQWIGRGCNVQTLQVATYSRSNAFHPKMLAEAHQITDLPIWMVGQEPSQLSNLRS